MANILERDGDVDDGNGKMYSGKWFRQSVV